jgi:hypothetical protein
MFMSSLNGVMRQVHSLFLQYGFIGKDKEEIIFARSDKPDETVSVKKSDLEGDWIVTCGGDPSKGDPQVELQKWMIALQLSHQYPDGSAATKSYDMWQAIFSRLLGYGEAAQVLQGREYYDKTQQAMQQAAQQQLLKQMEGKRTARQPKIKEPSGVPSSMVMR